MDDTVKSYAGTTRLKYRPADIRGLFVERDGEEVYAIEGVQDMDPFFMSIVSSSDHWMFVSSNGALTAGRKSPEIALFPYCTVDKIHDSAEITGPKSIIRVDRGGKCYLWEPFSDRLEGLYKITRNLYKNITGNKVSFEEVNHDLRLRFDYQWSNSEKFGFIRKSRLTNLSKDPVHVELVDGLQNILPQGVDRAMQTDKSCLVDAYKKCELIPETRLGLYLLSSIPVDRAEPSESLKANTVWSFGNDIQRILLSSVQLGRFRKGSPITEERDIVGKRGAYFVNIDTTIPKLESHSWCVIAEANQTASDIAALNGLLESNPDLRGQIEADVSAGSESLRRIVASADGLQLSSDKLSVARHFANTLFNVMRGGIFDDGYKVSKRDFLRFANSANRLLFRENGSWFDSLPVTLPYSELLGQARASGKRGLVRMCLEYMPLTFGRRHGDPSRPWNTFAIETRSEGGSKLLNYQGNWRDIFQNWEGLAISFPSYLESMIGKFMNASTADGYNPYRVTREGFEWEIHNPDDPWSNIGYWGDHQIIYLLKLLESSERFFPGILGGLLVTELFSYSNVPYRIKDYRSVLQDPYHSISYDTDLADLIARRVSERGADGKVIWDRAGQVYLVNLTEKLLVSLLSKFSNFVPEGGIWMNTQRPEWNDANNALAGYGLSMVTLYYLRRYVEFCRRLIKEATQPVFQVSEEVGEHLESVLSVFARYGPFLSGGFEGKSRGAFMDEMGQAGTSYRNKVYAHGFSEKRSAVSAATLGAFFDGALKYIDQTIRANKRTDGLYHSYNLLSPKSENEADVLHLYEMLEGQVAILSSGYLSPSESIPVFDTLRKSAMFREDQYSYILYPARTLPRFLEKNNIPPEFAGKSALLQALTADGNTSLVEKDVRGTFHFNGTFTSRHRVAQALQLLAERGYGELVSRESASILDIYESMFDHKAFTGRSGTFYSYEGLGSIYWHMVSKLLLAAEEVFSEAVEKAESTAIVGRLREIYFDIRKGLGTDKSPRVYGAFPTDPYSHTPSHSGAQQPGMTGQVKEDIITRFRELALVVTRGKVRFESSLLNPDEFLRRPSTFNYIDVGGVEREAAIWRHSLAHTFCQVPVILKLGGKNVIHLTTPAGRKTIHGLELDAGTSRKIFERTGEIQSMEVILRSK